METDPNAQDVSDQSIAAAFREADGKWFQSQHELRTWVETRARELQQAQSRNEWKDAVIDELITAHVYQKEHDTDPRKAIQDAITWNCQVALDPAVSSDARALVERGLQQAQVVGELQVTYCRCVAGSRDQELCADKRTCSRVTAHAATPQSSALGKGEW